MSLGIHLALLVGPTIAVPAPALLTGALQSVEVKHSDEERSGFQITFQTGRGGPAALLDHPLMSNPLLKTFNRLILAVTFNAMPRVLIDGIITHKELSPGTEPGTSTLTVTGEDISIMLDREEKSAEHPAQDETVIANKIILSYAQYGLIPMVVPPLAIDPPIPVERTPVQQSTDLDYLVEMAERHAYVFYILPGPAPLVSTAYWGPPVRLGLPQPALSVDLGSATNVSSINFRHNAVAPTLVSGQVQDRTSNQSLPVRTFASLRVPLSLRPTWLTEQTNVHRRQFRKSGLNASQAFARAQAEVDASVDGAVVAEGELDTLRYGGPLQPRGLVGVRGAGFSYDGLWYVKRVTHTIRKEEYKQSFTLTRDGEGSTTPVVRP
jgi:hypothetical protein